MKKKKIKIIIIILTVLLIPIFFVLKNFLEPKPIYNEPKIKLYLSKQDQVIELLLEDYIVGTVVAEMPASFEEEALKAQAVCARTYALRKLLDNKKYPQNADLSDDIYSCQAYISEEQYKKLHPGFANMYSKVKDAVEATRGEIIMFKEQPIDALYHSTCGGRTESASEVWGQDIPYLRSVKCEYCKESRYYSYVQVFSVQEFNRSLALGNKTPVLKDSQKTDAGRIKKITINDKEISGEKLRQKLGLPSTWCGFNIDDTKVEIRSRGYGHGLGLCQYGANGMAAEGKKYHQIIKKYYHGVEFYRINY